MGSCGAVAIGIDKGCEKLSNKHNKPRMLLDARADAPAPDPCEGTQSIAFECPAMRQSLLAFHKCPGSVAEDGTRVAGGGGGGGEIIF